MRKTIALFLAVVFLLSGCSLIQNWKMRIVEIKMAGSIDEKLMPVNVAEVFPEKTTKVFCWFRWKDAKVGTAVTARWHYVTDDIHILDYTFNIPRKNSAGSVSLSMPKGKALPSGEYKIDLTIPGRLLKTLNFKVE